MKIKSIVGREILDSRGFPTVECELTLDNGYIVLASVPAGASVSSYESLVLRDGEMHRFMGKGEKKAAQKISKLIAPILVDREPDFIKTDKELIELDGTLNKSNLGANTILAVSLAVAKAQALSKGVSLYRLIGKIYNQKKFFFPRIIANIINGGMHARNNLVFQEFCIVPINSHFPSKAVEKIFIIYQNLGTLLLDTFNVKCRGDEGGYSTLLKNGYDFPEHEALDFLMKAIKRSGFTEDDIKIYIDVAASTFFDLSHELYKMHEKWYTSSELVSLYSELTQNYPICAIEDGLEEEDFAGWSKLNNKLGKSIKIVGDDIFATHISRIKEGIDKKAANAAIIKPNQIGTLTETIQAISFCQKNNLETIVSHRSGETNDSYIIDLAIGCGVNYVKIGAPFGGERVAKYNRLLRIEENIKKPIF